MSDAPRTYQKPRQPRHRRPEERPRIVLTARDLAILGDVAEQRLLTADLVAWRHFPGRAGTPVEGRDTVSWAVQRRLQLLWQAGYLQRVFRPVRLGEGQAAIVYALDELGATALAQHHAVDRERFAVRRGQRPAEALFIEHTLGVARCWAALATACARTANLRLVDWRGESALKRAGLAERVRVRQAEGEWEVLVMPDGTGCLVLDDVHRARCFLELDLGTATNAVLAEKVRAYAAYLRTRHYAETYGEGSCLVLWVAAGARRLQNALRTLGAVVRDEPALRGRVLGAVLEELTPATALAPIWQAADSGERRALVRRGVRLAPPDGADVQDATR
jgi:hypothetical protein